MKKSIILIVLIISTSLQAQWVQFTPWAGSASMNSLYVSGDTIFGCHATTGLNYTLDLGVSWLQTGLSSGNVSSVSKSGNIILAASDKVYRSINNGANFTATTVVANLNGVSIQNNLAAAVTNGAGIFVSTNGGITWTNPITSGNYTAVAVEGNYIFASLSGQGLVRSTNSGANWEQTPLFPRSIVAIKTNGAIIYTGSSSGIDVSTNYGSNWQNAGLGQNVTSISVNGPSASAGTQSGGVYISTNNGANWTVTALNTGLYKAVALAGSNILASGSSSIQSSTTNGVSWSLRNWTFMNVIAVHSSSMGTFLSTGGIGIYRTTNDGLNWTQITYSHPDWDLAGINHIATISGNIVTGREYYGILMSTNNGANWLQSLGNNRYILGLSVVGTRLFAGLRYDGVWFSDFGSGWTWGGIGFNPELDIYTAAGNSSIVYAGSNTKGVYKSTNNGVNWSQTSITNDDSRVVAAIGNYAFARTSIGVSVSTDQGVTWSPTALLDPQVNCMAASGTILFVGVNGKGIYASTNYGQSFKNVNYNLGQIFSINKLNVYSNYLYAASPTMALLRAPVSSLVGLVSNPGEVLEKFSLEQNYPNPFNPATKINYSIQVASQVTLKIYDVLGNEVALLVNTRQNAGSYSEEFDAGRFNLSSGVYFYKLQTENFSDTKRMVLIK